MARKLLLPLCLALSGCASAWGTYATAVPGESVLITLEDAMPVKAVVLRNEGDTTLVRAERWLRHGDCGSQVWNEGGDCVGRVVGGLERDRSLVLVKRGR